MAYLHFFAYIYNFNSYGEKMGRIKVGLIGYGRMGGFFADEFAKSDKWELKYICDISDTSLNLAKEKFPDAIVTMDEDQIFNDPEVTVVALTALADTRLGRVRKAVATGKHIIAEKPIADSIENEWEVVKETEESGLLTTVDLYLRNSWYYNTLRDVIRSGELGELAIVRLCHMTPGLSPGEGHEFEGPAFHDCGMHYIDIARWLTDSEYKTWDAQAVRLWEWKDPWWLQTHGTFEKGAVFDITQGHNYGQLAKDQTHNSYADIIGTKGIARMTHDFKTAVVDIHGVTRTERIERPYGGKNIDRLIDVFADCLMSGKNDSRLPSMRDAAIASDFAWKMLDDARTHDLPSKGTHEELEQIWERRRTAVNGYGLIRKK